MILMIDNYDSFTYNIVQYLQENGEEVVVYYNDEITIREIEKLNPEAIFLSPGPGEPNTAGICLNVVQYFQGKKPLFGICLGHQVIVEAFGGTVTKAVEPMHGKVDFVYHDERGIYDGLPNPLTVTRYHSLVAHSSSVQSPIYVTGRAKRGEIMSLQHNTLPIAGVQFHPEAILTEHGQTLLQNFMNRLVRKESRV
ncbi:anthranilate synthase component II [Salirhabdus salicampi]|uniref:anthranilate synthase component II n=1 Tax=Salirhabdus salicampi TaxID=476102 RepID=UPI0020C54E0A|nr:aminodeoxychorismate/anthranilate synthase component II [Salirhabdus salicampi]MCP8615701.1 aminodeoxychorismate/anthranilate synthase component II [Salirhabdus salicampi]